ncbi:alginate biosynthesis protein AlgP [Rhodococcus sp. 14C212]|nr:alginate biosynthesis protein AlgP [Rhodococcus sp. 14C212]
MSESRTKIGSGAGSELVCPPKKSEGAGGYLKLAGQGATALARGPLFTGLFVARKGLDLARNMAGSRRAAATIEAAPRGRGRRILVTVGALGVVAAGGVVFYRTRLGDHPPVAPEPPRIEPVTPEPGPVATPEAAAPKPEPTAPKPEAAAPKPAAAPPAPKPGPAATPEAVAPKPASAAPGKAAPRAEGGTAAHAVPAPTPKATPTAAATPKGEPTAVPKGTADATAVPKGTADTTPTGKHAAKDETAPKPAAEPKGEAAGDKGTAAKPKPSAGPAGDPKKQG